MLGLPKRAEILMRRFLVEDTDSESGEALNGGIREHQEARKKVRFDHVTERISARLPERAEVELLDLPDGVPVLTPGRRVRRVRASAPGL
nr:UTRA domain-containing protein [Streptomyces sp. AC558_RSS880]